MLATTSITLSAFECSMHVPGESVNDASLRSEVDTITDDWRADTSLLSIDTPRCRTALASLDIRTATEREWLDELRLCPMTPDGCSVLDGCTGDRCATGVTYYTQDAWRVYLSPGEDTAGHGQTVRHETAHVLAWCTSGAVDYGHAEAAIWGANGVVWRQR